MVVLREKTNTYEVDRNKPAPSTINLYTHIICTQGNVQCAVQCLVHKYTYVHTYVGLNSGNETYVHTVKYVYNDHSWGQWIVVSVDRQSLYRGALVSLKWPMKQPKVVAIDRWSFYTSGLQSRFYCMNACMYIITYMCAHTYVRMYIHVCTVNGLYIVYVNALYDT